MQIRGLRTIALGVVLAVAVAGCSQNSKNGRGKNGDQYGASAQGMGDGSNFAGESGDLLSKRKIYFAFDRSDINQADYDIVTAHAGYLKQNQNRRIRIEGHADELGSREYNVALGERRARTVMDALLSQGAEPQQIATVSFGKEKPESTGHTDEAHALNRRAVIVYEEM